MYLDSQINSLAIQGVTAPFFSRYLLPLGLKSPIFLTVILCSAIIHAFS